MDPALQQKQSRLDERLRERNGLLVAYSGGVDSAYLAWRANEVLGQGMCAVIADSPSLARRHLEEAIAFAKSTAFHSRLSLRPSWKIPITRK